jgi:hypothetical protein
MDDRSTGTFTRTVDLEYILQGAAKYSTESTESPVSHILETDYFDTDLIEKTRHVKRLPKPYANQEKVFEELPFQQDHTIPCRVTLADSESSKLYLNGTLYHIQDTVEFYKAISHQPRPYCYKPEQKFTKLKHVRQISRPLRRPIFSKDCVEDLYWNSDDILAVDNRYLVNWFPQFKRNLYTYQEGHGILL